MFLKRGVSTDQRCDHRKVKMIWLLTVPSVGLDGKPNGWTNQTRGFNQPNVLNGLPRSQLGRPDWERWSVGDCQFDMNFKPLIGSREEESRGTPVSSVLKVTCI